MVNSMLWFDNSQSDLSAKIKHAVEYYVKKYNRQPDLCLVHPIMLTDDLRIKASFELKIGEKKILVRPYRPVLPGHIWIGMEDKE